MEALKLDPKSTALVLIDLQHGIVARDPKPHSAKDVCAHASQLAAATRAAGGTVIYVHVLLNETLRLDVDRAWPKPPEPLPAKMWEIVPEAGKQAGDLEVAKRQWGAFTGTDLDQLLRRKGVKTIILGGIATNIGVESTARNAIELGYNLVFAEDAMGTMSGEWHKFAIEQTFPMMGRVRSTDEIVKALG